MSYVLTVGLNPALQKILTFPRLTVDGVNRAAAMTAVASGKGINVARTLHLLGQRVVATGLLGGPTGAAIEAELKREGIASAFTAIAAPTRVCVTLEDRGRNTTTELIEPSPVVSDGEIERWVHAYESLVPWTHAVAISGTTPSGVGPGLYRRLIGFARRAGKPVLLDCGGALWREGAEAEPDVLKCNEAELADALGVRRLTPAKLVKAAAARARGETRWVVVTRGRLPALFVCRGRSGFPGATTRILRGGAEAAESASPPLAWWAVPPAIKPVNTVGSGDAVTAGMLAAIIDGAGPEDVIRRAVACGTANALISGPGVVRPGDVKRLAAEVRIRPI